ncbi:MAG: DUF5674 family protein [Candidatus Pacebacteria bacterium]|nr:DUF5674 family protein [Candidatus Paceibacterota bacterium]
MIATIEDIIIVRDIVNVETLNDLAEKWHHVLIKGVVDIKQGIVALGGEWHMDANNLLIENGSQQSDIWGFNIYKDETGEDALEYISLINIRPAQNNRSMEVEDDSIKNKMKEIIQKIVPYLGL